MGVLGFLFFVVVVLFFAGIFIEGLLLLFVLDCIFDMICIVFNITGDVVCVVIVDLMIIEEVVVELEKCEV